MTGFTEIAAAGPVLLAVGVSVLAGFVSFASPCVLPLVPGFLGYVTGLSDVALEKRGRGRLLLGALLFVLGFSVVFIAVSATASAVGAALFAHRLLLTVEAHASHRSAEEIVGVLLSRIRVPRGG